ncbi:MAG: hypothetical protein K8F25_03965 [Fimbriimonadaceae bacterium]|nr:hypothetical protein [Alphaproteobacteria bacterium]
MRIRLIFTDPAWILLLVWIAALIIFSFGPVRYEETSLWTLFGIIGGGLIIFTAGSLAGKRLPQPNKIESDPRIDKLLNFVIAGSAILGVLGVTAIAIDRFILSGVDGEFYALLLRCAPHLVDLFEIKRTPLLYVGYLTFSLSYVALALYWIEAESTRPWAAWTAHLAIISPFAYAHIYAGRMPILLMILLIVGASMARLLQGKTMIPCGQLLLLKASVVVAAMLIYSVWITDSRQDGCTATVRETLNYVSGLRDSDDNKIQLSRKQFGELLLLIENARGKVVEPIQDNSSLNRYDRLADHINRNWPAKTATYMRNLVEHGLPVPVAQIVLFGSFYFIHSPVMLGRIVEHNDRLSPFYGFYQIGILSPIERLFFPDSGIAARMFEETANANIRGYYTSIWGGSFLDFGLFGGIVYLFLFGLMAGYAWRGTQLGNAKLNPLLLSFCICTVVLSTVNGPLGISNPTLIFGSLLVVGLGFDLCVRLLSRRKN